MIKAKVQPAFINIMGPQQLEAELAAWYLEATHGACLHGTLRKMRPMPSTHFPALLDPYTLWANTPATPLLYAKQWQSSRPKPPHSHPSHYSHSGQACSIHEVVCTLPEPTQGCFQGPTVRPRLPKVHTALLLPTMCSTNPHSATLPHTPSKLHTAWSFAPFDPITNEGEQESMFLFLARPLPGQPVSQLFLFRLFKS